MIASHCIRTAAVALGALMICASVKAAEESIDSLLNRLPSPQKMVKPHVQQALQDPATKDPLASRAWAALESGDYRGALNLARQLAQKDSNSAFAHLLHGVTAIDADQPAEASATLHKSIEIEPGAGITHLVLGVAEMNQKHYAQALPSLQKSGELQPSWAVGWVLSSVCSERLGKRDQSLSFARRGTSVEPDWVITWIQLARARKGSGSYPGNDERN